MMYKKLFFFGVLVFLVPIIFVMHDEYITGLGWFGIEVMHSVQYHGIQMFFCLLVIAATLFFFGLAHPNISLWFGDKTRKRSSIIYGMVVGVAIVGLIEVNLIALGIAKLEDRTLASFYDGIEIGGSVHELRNDSISLNKHLRYTYVLAEREKALLADNGNRNFIEFSYPNQFITRRMILETNLHPGEEGSQIVGKYLLIDNRVAKSES